MEAGGGGSTRETVPAPLRVDSSRATYASAPRTLASRANSAQRLAHADDDAQRSMGIATFSEYYTLSFDLRKMANLASIAFFSSLGVLLRFGAGVFFSDYLQATVSTIERDASGILFHDLMVNVLGSWMMGLFAAFRAEIQGFSPALYVGLTTGLCGCATTFSAWVSSMVVLAWDFDDGCALYPFSAVLGNVIGFGLAYSAHAVGQHFATCLRHGSAAWRGSARAAQLLVPDNGAVLTAGVLAHKAGAARPSGAPPSPASLRSARSEVPVISEAGDDDVGALVTEERGAAAPELNRGVVRYFYEWDVTSECWERMRLGVTVLLWLSVAGVYIALYVQAAQQRERVLLLACIIAPVGAWLRYVITFSNKNTPTFPLYTYLCNLVSTVLSILIYVALTKVIPAGAERLGERAQFRLNEWLLALSLGFCGCLSTVSSFVHEVAMLWEKATLYDAYFYALTTLVSVHVICLAFLLPFSVHFSECENGPALGAAGGGHT